MNYRSKWNRAFRCLVRPGLRPCIALLLVALLGMEILPGGFVESVPATSGEQTERTFSLEPLQVCDHGDSFLGVLFDLPLLLPGAPCLLPSTEALPIIQQSAAFVPDGFPPVIDHPPRLSA